MQAVNMLNQLLFKVELSRMEQKVIQLVAIGLSNQAIAKQLNLSCRTVESHVSNMLNKTGLRNRTQLACWAIKSQILVTGDFS